MDTAVLQEIGLTEGEASVYLTLLEIGSTTAGPLIKKTGFHRATTYAILQRLIEKGLASSIIKGKKRTFSASDPSLLLTLLKEKEEHLLSLLPSLQTLVQRAKQKQIITVYEGFQGIKTVREKSLRLQKGETLYVLGASSFTTDPFNSYWQSYHKRRVKAGIRSKMLWSEDARHYGKEREALGLTEVKYLPPPLSTPISIDIFRDITAIDIFSGKPFTIEIQSNEVAEHFLKYFNLLWDQDIQIYRGEAVKELYYTRLEEMKKDESYDVLGAAYRLEREKMMDFYTRYHRARIQKGVKVFLLGEKSSYPLIVKEVSQAGDPKMTISTISCLPSGLESPLQINLYKKEVILIIWGKEPIAFSIKNQSLRDSFKTYFDHLWKLSTINNSSGKY